MIYFVTGASGFIGKRLVRTLLARSQATVYFLMRDASPARVEVLRKYWHATAKRAIPLKGDINQPGLGLSKDDIETLKNRVDHFFHLAAIYDLNADPEKEMATNIEGTRNAVRLAETIGAGRFHHFSSIAAAGLYEGTFREDMFEQARHLDHPYFASKHESEKVVRQECSVPWRIYRPGIVVGDSETGEMDKIDGPYYFFSLIKRMRAILPPWLPVVGIESRPHQSGSRRFRRGCRQSHRARCRPGWEVLPPHRSTSLPRGRCTSHVRQGRPRARYRHAP